MSVAFPMATDPMMDLHEAASDRLDFDAGFITRLGCAGLLREHRRRKHADQHR